MNQYWKRTIPRQQFNDNNQEYENYEECDPDFTIKDRDKLFESNVSRHLKTTTEFELSFMGSFISLW